MTKQVRQRLSEISLWRKSSNATDEAEMINRKVIRVKIYFDFCSIRLEKIDLCRNISLKKIDFFIKFNRKITAVEVKSAENTKSKSLNSIIDNWGIEQGIKLSSKNIGVSSKITNYPLYMAMFLN